MPANPDVERAKIRLARATRFKDRDPDEVAAARTAYNEARVTAWVAETLRTAPPHLTPETEARLARLLAGGAA